MADFIDLYDFEAQLEAAVASILTAGFAGVTPALTPQVLVSRSSDTKETARVEVQVDLGAAIDQYTAIGQANPRQVYSAYEFTLMITVATSRPDEAALMNPIHGPLVALSRYFMSPGAKSFNSSNLPNLQVLLLKPGQCRSQVQQTKEQDMNLLSWDGKFAIANTAWPASA